MGAKSQSLWCEKLSEIKPPLERYFIFKWKNIYFQKGLSLAKSCRTVIIVSAWLTMTQIWVESQINFIKKKSDCRVENGDWLATHHTMGSALMKKDFAEDSREYEVDLRYHSYTT